MTEEKRESVSGDKGNSQDLLAGTGVNYEFGPNAGSSGTARPPDIAEPESVKLRQSSSLNDAVNQSRASQVVPVDSSPSPSPSPSATSAAPVPASSKIVPQGIRSRWQNEQNQQSELQKMAAARAKTSPADDLKAAKKRWKIIILLSFAAVVLAFFAAASDVIVMLGGQYLANVGSADLPIALYRGYFKSDPGRAVILINWGNGVCDRNPTEAMAFYNEAARVAPKYASVYLNRGNDFGALKQEKEELADYNKAIELNPQYSLAFHNRGMYFRQLKMYQNAIADMTKAIETNAKYGNPDRNFLWYDRGYTYLEMKEHQKAIDDFTTGIAHGYSDHFAYDNRGYSLSELGRYKEAIADYDSALKLDPSDKYAYENRAYAYSSLANR